MKSKKTIMAHASSLYLRWQGYYDFDKKYIEEHVLKDPPVSGVYKIAELKTFGKLVPFYIAGTNDLYSALLFHLSSKETNRCLLKKLEEQICCFKFSQIIDPEEREDVVKTLFEHYHPVCNVPQDAAKGRIIDVNFH